MKNYIIILTAALTLSCGVRAQSYTYNHDASKQGQVTVMEVGEGSLTPTLYYTLLHNSYQKTAAQKNKISFRTLASIGAYRQVEYADSIESYTTQRAEIEALNVTDRQVDLAWQAEGTKITDKLSAFQNNINRIVPAGGSSEDYKRWNTYYKVYKAAITATRDAYMPNAQRKREYLRIYADLTTQNETLVKQLVQFNNKSKTEQLLSMRNNYQTANKETIAATAASKWREAGLSSRGSSANDVSNEDEGGEETVDR